jgi:hypothetical protein
MKLKYKDPGIEKFHKTNLLFTDDPYFLYQDPTILGFKLFFNFNSPSSRLLSEKENLSNSALNYLTNIGQIERAYYLKRFVEHLRKINNDTPWFFQTITGLGVAWKRGFNEETFLPALPNDRKITINCIESIDLRITALMDLYRKACFDWNYRREIIPWNLRTFDVWIYVYEARIINRTGEPSRTKIADIKKLLKLGADRQYTQNKQLLGSDPFESELDLASKIVKGAQTGLDNITEGISGIANKINSSISSKESANTINPYINRLLFKFKQCEFLPDESGDAFDDLGLVDENKTIQQKIVFSYKNVEEENLNNIYSPAVKISDDILRILDSVALDDLSSHGLFGVDNPYFNKIAAPLASIVAKKAEVLLGREANSLFLGNVFGFSPSDLSLFPPSVSGRVLAGNPSATLEGIKDLKSIFSPSKSLKNYSKSIKKGTNNFGESVSLSNGTNDVDSIDNSSEESKSISNRTNDVNNLGNIFE